MAMSKIGHQASRAMTTQESQSDKPRSKSAKRAKKLPKMKVKTLARKQAHEVLSHIQSREQGNVFICVDDQCRRLEQAAVRKSSHRIHTPAI